MKDNKSKKYRFHYAPMFDMSTKKLETGMSPEQALAATESLHKNFPSIKSYLQRVKTGKKGN